eukprot:gene17716-21122_t
MYPKSTPSKIEAMTDISLMANRCSVLVGLSLDGVYLGLKQGPLFYFILTQGYELGSITPNLTVQMTSEPSFIEYSFPLNPFVCERYSALGKTPIILPQVYTDQTMISIYMWLDLPRVNNAQYPTRCTIDSPAFHCSASQRIKGAPYFSISVSPTSVPDTSYAPVININITLNDYEHIATIPVTIPYGQPTATDTQVKSTSLYPSTFNMTLSSRDPLPFQLAYLTVENKQIETLLSYVSPMFSLMSSFMYLKRNQTHSTLMSGGSYSIAQVYRIDKNSPTVTGSFNNSVVPYVIKGTVTGDYILDNPTGTYFVRLSTLLDDVSLAAVYEVNTVFYMLPYPFGYTSRLVNGSMTFDATIPLYSNTPTGITAKFFSQFTIDQLNIPLQNPVTNFKPLVNSIKIRAFSSYSYIVRINVTDPVGFSRVFWDSYDFKTGSIIIEGDQYSGIFEFEISNIFYFVMPLQYPLMTFENLVPESGKFQVDYYAPYNFAGDFALPIPTNLIKFSLLDITHLEFNTSMVDLLDVPFENTIFFNITNLDKTAKPQLMINSFITPETMTNNHTFIGYYDNTRNMYRIDFIIPKQQMVGYIPFYLMSTTTYITNDDIRSFFNESLYIRSTLYGDIMRPMIMEISQFPASPFSVQPTEKIMIGWNLTIEDYPNSFKSGVAKIISELDNEAIVINFNSSNLVSGDRFRDDAGDMELNNDFDGIQPIIGGVYDDMRRLNIICP